MDSSVLNQELPKPLTTPRSCQTVGTCIRKKSKLTIRNSVLRQSNNAQIVVVGRIVGILTHSEGEQLVLMGHYSKRKAPIKQGGEILKKFIISLVAIIPGQKTSLTASTKQISDVLAALRSLHHLKNNNSCRAPNSQKY